MMGTRPAEDPQVALPVWAQVVMGLWALGCVIIFLRQTLVAYGGS